jgi:hypothetical protein
MHAKKGQIDLRRARRYTGRTQGEKGWMFVT